MGLKKLWEHILDFFGFDEEFNQVQDSKTKSDDRPNAKIVSLNKKKNYKLIFHSPDSYNEVKNVVDDLKDRSPIILNIEGLEKNQARRILDFISGAVYGINGSVQKVGSDVFLFTPSNIQIDGEELNQAIDEKIVTS